MSTWSVTSAVFDVCADVTKMSLAILPSALNASGVWMSALHSWGHHTAWRYGQDLERNVTRTLMHFSPSIFLLSLLSLRQRNHPILHSSIGQKKVSVTPDFTNGSGKNNTLFCWLLCTLQEDRYIFCQAKQVCNHFTAGRSSGWTCCIKLVQNRQRSCSRKNESQGKHYIRRSIWPPFDQSHSNFGIFETKQNALIFFPVLPFIARS